MKIWLDFCEPKSVTMLRPLYNRLIKSHHVFITARDFDSTYALLDDWGVPYIKVGKHGGADLIGKLRAFSDRLRDLIEIIAKEKPDFLFCITSPEAIRIAFGLHIPHIMFNDEPRSKGPSALTLPFLEYVIVPKPIPLEWYTAYGIPAEKIIRFNGIDEVGWLNSEDFVPNSKYLASMQLTENRFIVCRTEPTQAYAHLDNRPGPGETLLTQIVPTLLKFVKNENRADKILIITRYQEQFTALSQFFSSEIKSGEIILTKNVVHLADVMYFSALVISGGGTMVRESALLGVPSIEFIPTDTYPQEQFLIDQGFPLIHLKTADAIIKTAKEYLVTVNRKDTREYIKKLENPILVGLELFSKEMQNREITKN